MAEPLIRRSVQLSLSFPYDWSNPDISDEALLIGVLKRGIFADICKVTVHYGFERVERVAMDLSRSEPGSFSVRLSTMLNNIRLGFERAQDR